jgi:hypothetical protein
MPKKWVYCYLSRCHKAIFWFVTDKITMLCLYYISTVTKSQNRREGAFFVVAQTGGYTGEEEWNNPIDQKKNSFLGGFRVTT